jgi:MoxR-like ATPase
MELTEIRAATERLRAEVHKVVVGQDRALDLLLVALLSDGHVLVEGVPGVAKTLLARAFATALGIGFGRIQFTPDLMPGDVLGTNLFNFQTNAFVLTKGPIFADVLVADEINRTPPKTQAALLQAMQERAVTIDGTTHVLSPAFMVIATQNPIEQEGTYPLPEAQLDRFMFQIDIGYPSAEEEGLIVSRTTSAYQPSLGKVVAGARIQELQGLVRRVPVAEYVVDYAVRLAQASRPGDGAPEFVRKWVSWGAGPRASQYLILGGKARAVLEGRYAVTVEDVRALAPAVLKHRIIPNFNAEAEGVGSPEIIRRLLDGVRPEK